MLNYEGIRLLSRHERPFRFAVGDGVFASPEVAEACAATFPDDLLQRRTATGPGVEKAYDMFSVTLAKPRPPRPALRLAPVWARLVDHLCSPRMARLLGAAMSVTLDERNVEIRACAYGNGGLLAPHTDRPDKLLSLILYLDRAWQPGTGGELGILRSCDPEDEAVRVEPRLGRMAVLLRSDRSWHHVRRFCAPGGAMRRSVLVHYQVPLSSRGVDDTAC
jgi:SM-20-related protein